MTRPMEKIAEDMKANEPDWYDPPVAIIHPHMHNNLRVEVGMDRTNHCDDCWGVMEDGECKTCGGTDVYGDG